MQRNQRSNCQHPLDHGKSKRVPEKHLFLLYWLCQSLDCVEHNELWKILIEMEIPDHLVCLLRNLYAGQEATVRTGHRTMDWLQIGKEVRQGCILSLCLFNLCTSCSMPGWMMHKLESRFPGKISITSDMQMKPFLWQKAKNLLKKSERGEWKAGLKLNIQKIKIMTSSPISSRQIDGETMETVTDFFWGVQNNCRWWLQPWN